MNTPILLIVWFLLFLVSLCIVLAPLVMTFFVLRLAWRKRISIISAVKEILLLVLSSPNKP